MKNFARSSLLLAPKQLSG